MKSTKQVVKGFSIVLCLSLMLPAVMFGQRLSGTNFSGVVGSGARALGMGGAFIAIVDDATAASWNPAGLGQLERPELTLVARAQSYRNAIPAGGDGYGYFLGPDSVKASSYGIDFASFTYPIRIAKFKIVPQISFQRAINYNLSSKTNNVQEKGHWWVQESQAYIDYDGEINKEQDFSGGLDNLTVSVGLNPLKWINIGVSVNYWMNGYEGVTQEYHWGEYSGDIDATDIKEFYKRERISLDIKGYNFNVGILVKPFKNFKIGMVYKSSFSADITYDYLLGEGNSVGAGGEEEEEEEEDRSSIAGTSRLQWPTTWGMGLSYQPIDQLTVSADFTFTQWSKGIMKNFPDFETYDPTTQSVEYIDMFFPMMRPVKSLEDLENPSKQLDTKQFRFGIEYVLIGKKVLIPLRLGFFTDAQYFMDCTGEEVNFTGITGGFGVKKGGLSLDFAVLLEIGSYLRDVDDYSTTSYTEMKAFMSTSFSF